MGPLKSASKSVEDAFSGLALVAITLLPLLEIASRRLIGEGIPGSIGYVQHLTLWIGFLGAALAAREQRHLSLSAVPTLLKGRLKLAASVASSAIASAVTVFLAVASAEMVWHERASVSVLGGGVPVWVAQLIMPIGFAITALRLFWQTPGGWAGRTISAAIILVAIGLGYLPEDLRSGLLWLGLALILLATALGAPIFILLGGAALFFFYSDGRPIAAIAVEAYRIASSPTLPTVPLFALAGSILASGGASTRLVRVFRALFGWMPGGTAIAAVGVSAFFTTFTGASGVTILALGALLFPILIRERYGERFSVGLLTAAGSLGVVFPPCLPVILYGVVSHTPIDRLFLAGLVPGMLMVAVVALYSAQRGIAAGVSRSRFDLREAASAVWAAKWEILLPAFVLISIFSGYATLVEAAALTALYAFVVECLIYKDISFRKDIPRILTDCSVMVGGVLIILSAAMGFTSYLVDAEVPLRAAEWVQARIQSQWVFLLALNFFLLIVGCLMDIFSAIVVVVPLIAPIGEAFKVDPVHLGIIFLINMELGYITPPVGMNLFLASYRFDRPLGDVYRASIPFLIVMAVGVLLVTYIPAMTTGVLRILGR